jgi:hypothetical protein
MECALVICRGYESLLALARCKGILILEATNGGFLDVVEPADYEEFVSDDSVESEQGEKSAREAACLIILVRQRRSYLRNTGIEYK